MTRATLLVALLLSGGANALTASQDTDGVNVTVYAPDWTWHGQMVNVLVVLRNDTAEPRHVALRLDAQADVAAMLAEMKYNPEATIDLAPGESRRFAFANLPTSALAYGRTYEFRLGVRANGAAPASLPLPVQLVRGAVVAPGIWAAILPAAVAAAWCLVLAWYLRRHAAPGAWKTPSAPVWEAE